MGLGINRGISEQLQLNFNSTSLEMNPDLLTNTVATNGATVLLLDALTSATGDFSFSLASKLNGSERLFFTPAGKKNTS